MFFSSSPLDRAADKYVRARFKMSKAERQGKGVEDALVELHQAEARWRAACEVNEQDQHSFIERMFPHAS